MQKNDLNKINLPNECGVYLFKKGRTVLYVGKATNLKDRVRSYFDNDLITTRGPRIVDMVTRADKVSFETTQTVLEALVRESVLIKKYYPRANVEGKDDKTFIYVVLTKEDWPRVLMVRGKDIDFEKKYALGVSVTKIFGPFPNASQLREALRLVRRIFPFYDTERPVTNKSKHIKTKIEFNRQIGQYPVNINQSEYKRSINRIALLLGGRFKELRKKLEIDMRRAAKDENFETAAEYKREIFTLGHIQDVSLIKDDTDVINGLRIEAYDTAHLSGTNTVAVMVVIDKSVVVKKAYRTFNILGSGNDDIASLKEVISRRLSHPEWELPRAIVVDGGKTHKKAAESVLFDAGVVIPIIAVVKDSKHKPREIIGSRGTGIKEFDIILANNEAHRFAISRHRAKRKIK